MGQDERHRPRATLFARELKNPLRSARNLRRKRKSEGWCLCFSLRFARFRQYQTKEKRKRNADRRAVSAASADAAPPKRGGSPIGVPPRFSPQGAFVPEAPASGQASWDVAGALGPVGLSQPGGRDFALLHGRYPRPPVPVQCSTSRSGHSAGEHDARAARERGVWPRRGHRTRSEPQRVPPLGSSSMSEVRGLM